VQVHLVDGTYELFRHFFAVPSKQDKRGQEIGAVRGVVASILSMIKEGATHIGVATDHVIESFRNDLYPGYKTSEGVAPELLSQFPILEEALQALGVAVWPMVEFEADDALASAAALAAADKRVQRVFICTPDKDLAQSVSGTRVVQLIRRTNVVIDEAAVIEKFGVKPESIPDYLALVGDSADGYPGLAGWGPKKSSSVLAHYKHLENIPAYGDDWKIASMKPGSLAQTFRENRDKAMLFRTLATLRSDLPLFNSVDELEWRGPASYFPEIAARLESTHLKIPAPASKR
jgi:5'-3' exonuclease